MVTRTQVETCLFEKSEMQEFMWDSRDRTFWSLVSFCVDNGIFNYPRTIYRGQSNSTWNLTPGIYRHTPEFTLEGSTAEDRYIIAEEHIIQHFFTKGATLLRGIERSNIVDRIMAQHYGAPTQLLDWTVDPFIAIFFAAQDGREESDGALFFLNTLGTRNPRFVNFPHRGPLVSVLPPHIDERVKSQKSVFTVQSFGADKNAFTPLNHRTLVHNTDGNPHPDDEAERFGRITIPHDRKMNVRRGLEDIGIDSSLIYPGLQGIGERIADHVVDVGTSGLAHRN